METDALLLLFIIPLVIVIYLLLPMLWGAGYAPSPKRDAVKVMKHAIEKYLDGNENISIVDLGSGFGGICFEAVKRFPNAVCTGIEIDPIKVLWSRIASRFKKYGDRTRFIWGNIFNIDLGSYDIVYMFLWPLTVSRIEDKILKEVKKKIVVISLEHPLTKIRNEKYGDFYIGFKQ